MAMAAHTGCTVVQLHGCESPESVQRLRREGLFVIKALFADRAPGIAAASRFPASAFLVECGQGPLPGGNARAWQWGRAAALGERHPLILAGGLDPQNAAQSVRAALPDAVDVSSGVEVRPGRKDIRKVEQFIAAVATATQQKEDIRMHPSHASLKEAHGRLPDAAGHFGPFGGRYVAETLMPALLELEEAYRRIAPDPAFPAGVRPPAAGLRRPADAPLFSPSA